MLTFHRILFPVDLSPRCTEMTAYVAAIAHKFQSELFLLQAFGLYEGDAYGEATPSVVYAAYEDTIQQDRIAKLESFGCEEFKALKVTRAVEVGDAAHRVIQYADEHGIDLIIMPTHGRGRFRRLLVGSVTSKVLHDTGCPVWTTAHSEAMGSQTFQNIDNIVVAIDTCSDAIPVIRMAQGIADKYGATVRLAHAISCANFDGAVVEQAPLQRFLFDTANDRIAELQRDAQTKFDTCIKLGSVATVVRDVALSCNAQLVVIGRGRMQDFLGRLRTNVGAIIRESPCPVLSV